MPKYYEISFSYTLRCNAVCCHCCANAGPSRRAKLQLGEVYAHIRSASRYGIKFIAFTGGEVTLLGKELFKALSCCRDYGIDSILVSNAQWASSRHSADSFARRLQQCGVVETQLSTDMFHVPFVPFRNVLNAIDALRNYRIRPIVMFTRTIGDRSTQRLKRIVDALKVETVQQAVVPFAGRSQSLPMASLRMKHLQNMQHIGCISVLSPTVSPSNGLYACCASDFSFADGSALYLGDLNRGSLHSILASNERNRVLDALYLWGPKFLHDLAKKHDPNLVQNFDRRYFGYCDLCYSLMKTARIVDLLRAELQDQEMVKRIEIAKLIKHQKIREMRNTASDWYECVIEREEA